MIRVDAHHHLWDLAVRDQPWTAGLAPLRRSFSLDDLRPQLAAANIDRTVVVQTITVAEETPELLALADREPVIAGVVGWVDLTAPDVGQRLETLQAMPGGGKLVGIRHQVQEEADPRWLTRPEVLAGLRTVAAHHLVYDLLIVPDQFPAAIDVVAELPELDFVLDHAGKPAIAAHGYDRWYDQLAELALLPNVAVKLSGLITEADHADWTAEDIAPYGRAVIGEFGPDRVMYGSDWPVCTLAGDYLRVIGLVDELISDLPQDQREMIMGRTAARWYKLKED